MTISEGLLLISYSIEPVAIIMLVITAVIAISFIAIFFLTRKLGIDSKLFPNLSIFFELSRFQSIKLSCSFIKLLLVIIYLIMFKELQFVHYLFFILPCIISVISKDKIYQILINLFYVAIQGSALLTANLLCTYILTFDMNVSYFVVYLLIATATILCSIYFFIVEIDAISAKRRTNEKNLFKKTRKI